MIFNIHWWIKKSENYLDLYEKIIKYFFQIIEDNYVWIWEWNELIFSTKHFNKEISDKLSRKTLNNEILNFIYYLQNKKYIKFKNNTILFYKDYKNIKQELEEIIFVARELINKLLKKISTNQQNNNYISIDTSFEEIKNIIKKSNVDNNIDISYIEKILLFLHKLEIIKVNSWIFVFQTYYRILKTEKKGFFTDKDYENLKDYYTEKIRQVHILWEYIEKLSNRLSPDTYIEDYFNLSIDNFITKYFNKRKWIIERPVTEHKYEQIIKELSPVQKEIVEDKKNNIIVIAWPGSWKTKVLIHKVASLILLEWVKLSQFLMISFSRSAKYEIKNRLLDLLWNEAYGLEIETFHSYSFKKLWLEWNLEDKDVIQKATELINEQWNLAYKVILIDEFQDIDKEQFELINAIKNKSEAKIIAVGDDDQNIYEFREADIWYIREFKDIFNAKKYELNINYRSTQEIVDFTNKFIEKSKNRIKENKLKSNNKISLFDNIFENNIEFYEATNLNVILEKVLDKYKNENDIWILTFSNEKVLQIKSSLDEKWQDSEIILSKLNFKLNHLLELKILINSLQNSKKHKFSDIEIKKLFKEIAQKYWENINTKKIDLFLDNFIENKKTLYLSHLIDYFKDSELDDILEDKRIKISTFHKAKWKEFGSIVMIFDEAFWQDLTEEQRRLIYVWLTRAKKKILCYWNKQNLFFKELLEYNSSKNIENWDIENKKISLILWLEDVNLWWHEDKKNNNYYQIWDDVTINNEWWCIMKENIHLQALSKNWKKKIKEYEKKWYIIKNIKIFNRLLYKLNNWKEVLVYLFTINMEK